jgi:hypothetical protein
MKLPSWYRSAAHLACGMGMAVGLYRTTVPGHMGYTQFMMLLVLAWNVSTLLGCFQRWVVARVKLGR